MVSESPAESFDQQSNPDSASELEFEIIDGTSPEQLERERELLSPTLDEAPEDDTQSREPEHDASEIERPLADSDAIEDASKREPAQPEPRSYSQAEVSKMQAAWAKQIEQARRSEAAASKQLERYDLDAAVEATLRTQERELAAEVGPDAASQTVRSPRNAALVRQTLATQQQLKRSEAERTHAVQQQELQARYIVAQSLAREHSVAPEDFEALASASTPRAMQNLARRLGKASSGTARDRVPAETPQTELENGYSAGPQPETPQRRLQRIREKPSWEWTEADLRYMKTGEVR